MRNKSDTCLGAGTTLGTLQAMFRSLIDGSQNSGWGLKMRFHGIMKIAVNKLLNKLSELKHLTVLFYQKHRKSTRKNKIIMIKSSTGVSMQLSLMYMYIINNKCKCFIRVSIKEQFNVDLIWIWIWGKRVGAVVRALAFL